MSKTYPNEGARRLMEVAERLGHSIPEVAAKLGTDTSTVYRWIYEGRLPSLTLATKAQREYGISTELWTHPAQEHESAQEAK